MARLSVLSLLVIFGVILGCNSHYHHGRNIPRRVKRQAITCDNESIYRTIDGQCNNIDNPSWGSAETQLLRLLPNAYSDGVSSPRQVEVSARTVSVKCHKSNLDRADVSLMVMQWGQFLDHDLTFVHTNAVPDSEACCSDNENSECFSIRLDNDEYFTDRTCLPLTRSIREPNVEGVQEQVNSLTAYLDGSQVYGSSEEELTEIRGSQGLLRMAANNLLPEDSDALECIPEGDHYCFLGGDERVNEQPALAAMHTIFAREHNRIARKLSEINPEWNEETLFQETRRIVIAILQVITYEEFLPIVLSDSTRERYNLNPGNYRYSPKVNPSIANSFAAAAFRFGHSLIPDSLTLSTGELMFKDVFFKSESVFESLDELSESLYSENSMKVDKAFSHSITRHLFQEGERTGSDLVARNIQRGRDHGLPSYNDFREFCQLPRRRSLTEVYPDDTLAQSAYTNVDDVDLFSGAMSEPAEGNGLVGETLACLLGLQFENLKQGDRFFYESQGERWSFTEEQLDEIKRMRLSKVVCENTENKRVPRNVFKPNSRRVSCNAIPDINWSVFRDSTSGGDADVGAGNAKSKDRKMKGPDNSKNNNGKKN